MNYRHSDPIWSDSQGHTLWIGDIVAAEQVQDLIQKNIKTVITAAQGFKIKYDPKLLIKHYVFPLRDIKSENIASIFNQVSNIIERCLKYGNVLVHCGAGVSRSTTLVIAFLISKQKMSFRSALKLCKMKRPQVCPNLGFELQLKQYQKQKTPMPEMTNSQQQFKDPKLLSSYQINFSGINKKLEPIKSFQIKSPLEKNNILNRQRKGSTFHKTHRVAKSIDPKLTKYGEMNSNYLKKMAAFRFGFTTDKWQKF